MRITIELADVAVDAAVPMGVLRDFLLESVKNVSSCALPDRWRGPSLVLRLMMGIPTSECAFGFCGHSASSSFCSHSDLLPEDSNIGSAMQSEFTNEFWSGVVSKRKSVWSSIAPSCGGNDSASFINAVYVYLPPLSCCVNCHSFVALFIFENYSCLVLLVALVVPPAVLAKAEVHS